MDLKLLETTAVQSDGSIFLLDRHLQRLAGSARHFGFRCDPDLVRQRLLQETAQQPKPSRIRLLLDPDGNVEIQFAAMPTIGSLKWACLSQVKVLSTDPMLRHKTTARQVYDRAHDACEPGMDAILSNELGQLTEMTIANFAIERAGKWVTPPVDCGLLPGTLRAELLEQGKIEEGVLAASDLRDGEPIRCFNSVRGIYDLHFIAR